MHKNILILTDRAIEQVKLLLAKRNKPAFGIRVGVKSGGCSGIVYYIEYADEKNKFDEVVEVNNVKILIDSKALMYLIGSIMDYVEDKFKTGFAFTNPNEKGSCGCGKSFSA
ncbi:iron-sulfur cluster assembly accessory protein [Candidatus Tisiphia endosymbiont of Beris chalybata]|uniref:iron-sulfur cluster assembly accessory protein n=1 Tax=Candidatus Tisiphia endosymbiont of Beris chalybata TaxID=3066262 RepID=UPI00312C6DAA